MPNLDGGHYFFTGLFPVHARFRAARPTELHRPQPLVREALRRSDCAQFQRARARSAPARSRAAARPISSAWR